MVLIDGEWVLPETIDSRPGRRLSKLVLKRAVKM
jgi:hypothetical protein